MRQLAIALFVFTLPAAARGEGKTAVVEPGTQMTCGQKLVEQSKLQSQAASTINATADYQEAHAKWVGNKTKEAKAEHDELMKLARMNRDLSKQIMKIHDEMAKQGNLPAAPHPAEAMEPVNAATMKVVEEQRNLATLLNKSSDEMEGMVKKGAMHQ